MSLKNFVLFLLPALVFSALLYYGIFWNIAIALTHYSVLDPTMRFTGLSSFVELFSDSLFVSAFIRTLLWAALLVALGNLIGLLLAGAIFQFENIRLRNMLTTFFLYPFSLSLVVVGIIWRWLYDPYKGIDNILAVLGLPRIQWLEGDTAFWSLVLTSIWVYAGFVALLYLAMFYNIDKSLIESALVDGAGPLTILTKIVIPNSKQGLIIATIFLALFAIQMFDLPYSVLYLNPFTMTMVMYVYAKFASFYFYLASAAAIVIVVVSAFIVIPYAVYGLKRWILGR
ncbi:MAG: sugar ABC transporter permease [Pyrodictiaceae archaeon]